MACGLRLCRCRGPLAEVRLVAGTLELVARGRDLDDRDPEVSGNAELTENVSLAALTLGYAANELAYRRARSPERRASHRKAADAERKDALALADLVTSLGPLPPIADVTGEEVQPSQSRRSRAQEPPRARRPGDSSRRPDHICVVFWVLQQSYPSTCEGS